MRINHITLNPPYRLGDDQTVMRFVGWCEILDPEHPAISLEINGKATSCQFCPRPDVQAVFPDLRTVGVVAQVDLVALLQGADPMQDKRGFLLNVRVCADDRERTFEYAVSEGWLQAVFGRPLRAYPVPPEPLQIRVTGAAAGAFVRSGHVVADQIEHVLAEGGAAFPDRGKVYDFGAGPGRVLGAFAVRYPHARYWASDIDAEAMAWCAQEMADVGEFFTNGHAPPLPFPDNHLDLIYSISIFTHLPEDMQDAWLKELRRVLKPGGYLLTTKINPFAYELPASVRAEAEATGFAYFGGAAPVEGLPDFYRLAYHSADYVRRAWGRFFQVVHVGSHDLNDTQDAVLLRKR